MATAMPLDGLTRLRRLDPRAAALADAVASLLAADGLEPTVLHAVVSGPWFSCGDGVRFRIEDPVPLDDTRVGDAVALLDRADPLLMRVERLLGLSLEPIGIEAEAIDDRVILSFAGEGVVGTIAISPAHPGREEWQARARALPPAAATMPAVLRILVHGPRVGIAEAGDLAPGDLVLIAPRPAATIEQEDGAGHPGQLDFATGNFTLHPQGAPMVDEPPARDFAVPLTLKLPDRATSAASLAALRPGMALPLGPLTDGMPIELLVAGRPLARGELVQLGDRFAVLIEERSAIDDAGRAEPVDIDADEQPMEMPA
jgi:flagellar motor switch/type III secretory pathway protein FliN